MLMTGLSPINANLIKNGELNKNQNRHDKVYKNLIAQASVVKPNKARAVLVKENFPQSVISSIKGFIQDGKNFFKATATGHMDDNSLGRINDFGMKVGGLAIATFLASQAKTKTHAAMQYIGGSAFFASMALWPKLFINLPARIVHGFRIDQKYISAQNERKDFFLDNQFLPWDAFSKEELRKNAIKSGIDYDSENGDEKIKRKMQKTALQNRTLWMATAGFATPLMTSLFGDWIEPKVKNHIIKHDSEKALDDIKDVNSLLKKAKPIVKNQKEIDAVFADMKSGKINAEEMFEKLSELLSFDMAKMFNSGDDIRPVENLKYSTPATELKALRNQTSYVTEGNLKEILTKAFGDCVNTVASETKESGSSTNKAVSELQKRGAKLIPQGSASKESYEGAINAIVEEFHNAETKNYVTLSGIVQKYLGPLWNKKDSKDSINARLDSAGVQFDDSEFIQQVKDYNANVISVVRGRLKAYIQKIINPVMGRKDESLYTDMYRRAMKGVIPEKRVPFRFPVYDKETIEMLEGLKNAKRQIAETKDGEHVAIEVIDSAIESASMPFKRIAGLKDDLYTKELERMCVPKSDSVTGFAKSVASDDNLNLIVSELGKNEKNSAFKNPIRDLQEWISKNLKTFVDNEEINNNSIRAKGLICANLERRIKDNTFKQQLEAKGLISGEFTLKDLIQKARYMVYEGSIASDACGLEIKNENIYRQLRDAVFDKNKFALEKRYMKDLDKILDGLKTLGTSTKDNNLVTGLANLEKTFVTDLLNNQAWKKLVPPAFLALVATTLLVQPLFGNIKKDFPQDAKGGNN